MSETYRLTFETLDARFAADIEAQLGKNCWPTLDFDKLRWHIVRRTGGNDILGQHTTLKRWAETHEQPIRNVVLEILVSEPQWQVLER